jgi:CRISPR/Cas system CSM-associated protein Csm2 small subunit
MKQKNNFLMADHNKKIENNEEKAERRRSHEAKNSGTYFEEGHRCRAKSNIMHLDDTQIRQALYKDPYEESEPEPVPKNKQKKSHSMIEKRHQ